MNTPAAKNLRLLILSQYFWPENFYINALAQTLAGQGVQLEVLTGKPNYPAGVFFDGYRAGGCQRESCQGIAVHRIPMLARGRGAVRLALNYLSFVLSGLVFAPWLLRGKAFDAILVYAPSPILQAIPALLVGRLKRAPVVLWVQDLWPDSLSATGHVRNRLALRLVDRVVRFIYRHVDLLLVQSEAFRAPVTGQAGGTPVVYYPNSVEDVFDQAGRHGAPAADPEAGFSVLFAGNIGSAQAVEVIVGAAERLRTYPDIRFVVVGDGSRRQWMIDEVERRGLTNVSLPGKFPLAAMPDFMGRASVLLVTLADQEIFRLTIPSKVQAYLAAGRPIIAALNGEGGRLIVDSGAGLAVPAEDETALAEAILALYRLPQDEREAMGIRGRMYYERHFAPGMLAETLIGHLRTVRG